MHRQIVAPLNTPVLTVLFATLALSALSPGAIASTKDVSLAACLSNVELLKVVRSLSDAEFEAFCVLNAKDHEDFIRMHGYVFPTDTVPPLDIDGQPDVDSRGARRQKVEPRKNGLTEWLEPTQTLLTYIDSLPTVMV